MCFKWSSFNRQKLKLEMRKEERVTLEQVSQEYHIQRIYFLTIYSEKLSRFTGLCAVRQLHLCIHFKCLLTVKLSAFLWGFVKDEQNTHFNTKVLQ